MPSLGHLNLLRLTVSIALSMMAADIPAAHADAVADEGAGPVILLTLDGVRWQELFGKESFSEEAHSPFEKNLWGKLVMQGTLYGHPDLSAGMFTSNPYAISLPGYQSIMTGRVQPCSGNECGRVPEATMLDRIAAELKYGPSEMATFASWWVIHQAASHFERPAHWISAGSSEPAPAIQECGVDFADLNAAAAADRPSWDAKDRKDKYTFAMGLRYLEKCHPKFLYISLVDADEWAHKWDIANYYNTLKTYDANLGQLDGLLQSMGEYGKKATLIVTTDHGRGEWLRWSGHSNNPQARRIWMYAKGPRIKRTAIAHNAEPLTHNQIRPTIETLLGLKPCETCEAAIPLRAKK